MRPPQILVELAGLQDQEVGDGTTSVVVFAAELLRRANDLVRNKIHPTSIITGYRLAMREVRPPRRSPATRHTYLLLPEAVERACNLKLGRRGAGVQVHRGALVD